MHKQLFNHCVYVVFGRRGSSILSFSPSFSIVDFFLLRLDYEERDLVVKNIWSERKGILPLQKFLKAFEVFEV